MFCKHCGHKLNAGDAVCPGCGTPIDPAVFEVKNFKVELPDHEEELQALLSQTQQSAPQAEAPAADAPNTPPDAPTEPPVAEEPFVLRTPDDAPDTSSAPESELPAPEYVQPVPRYVPVRETKAARRSRAALKALVCVFAAVILALVVLRMTTDLFDSTDPGLQPVSLNTLTDEEKAAFLEFFSPYAPLVGTSFRPQTLGVAAFFELLDLNVENNLYAARFSQPTRVTDVPDPAERFAQPDGSYSYYKIEAAKLNELADSFGVELPGAANNSRYYYYDGSYYFAADAVLQPAAQQALTVSQTKQTEDGNYYIVCADARGVDTAYCLASLDRMADAVPWRLLELSNQPLFREDGTKITAETDALDYEIRHEVVEAKAADGTLFARYVLDYPFFTDALGEPGKTLNALYEQMLASYKEQAQSAEENYASYVKRDYDTSLLPAYTYMVSAVTYNKNGYISLLDELTEYAPETLAKELKKAEEENPESEIVPVAFTFPTVTYSGTTVNTGTGAFLRRDDFFTDSYETYQAALYRIYMGQDAEAPQASEPTTAPTETPWGEPTTTPAQPTLTDAEATIAQNIYASPMVLSESGVRFCYLNPEGYYDYVVLPYSYLDGEY